MLTEHRVSPAPSGLSSTMRKRDAENLDAAAALQLAERVLSRHAQLNPAFQYGAAQPESPHRAEAPGLQRRSSKSCNSQGMMGILQQDPATQRSSRGLEALNVQIPSRANSYRRVSAGTQRSASRRSIAPSVDPGWQDTADIGSSQHLAHASHAASRGAPTRMGSTGSALDSFMARLDSGSMFSPASDVGHEQEGDAELGSTRHTDPKPWVQGSVMRSASPLPRAASQRTASRTASPARPGSSYSPARGRDLRAQGKPADAVRVRRTVQTPGQPPGFREDSAREAHALQGDQGWTASKPATLQHSSSRKKSPARKPRATGAKQVASASLPMAPVPAAAPEVKGPKATLSKRAYKGDGKLTAANLAGLGGSVEEVDSHDRTLAWVRDAEVLFATQTPSTSSRQLSPPEDEAVSAKARALDSWRMRRQQDEAEASRPRSLFSAWISCWGR